MASLDFSASDRSQLKAWFAAQRARAAPVAPLAFSQSAAELFSAPPAAKGGALGVDFVDARKAATVVDLGAPPKAEVEGRPKLKTLRVSQGISDGGIAGCVWNCGRVLCWALPRLPEVTDGAFANPATRILELGCGTGVVGLACWLRGAAEVVLTDLPDHVALARDNASSTLGDDGALPAGVRVVGHAWGEPLGDELAGDWDVVVASDCLYDVNALPGLLKTLGAVASAKTVAYLAYKRRVDEREAPFFEELSTLFETVALTAFDAIPEAWRGTGLYVVRATGRKVG
mmetsp:Transcript_23340/g.72106  ORF Transcript_23340/g.72106 Transcript_23340/m.72106 type:complete len:287 (-) Transcript_23340:99-959(-)